MTNYDEHYANWHTGAHKRGKHCSSSELFLSEPLLPRLLHRIHCFCDALPFNCRPNHPERNFSEALGLSLYTLYMQDYGGPVGFAWPWPTRTGSRLSSWRTLWRTMKAWEANWKPRPAFWADRASNESALRTNLLSLPTIRTHHVGNDPNVERYDPDLSTDEFAFLSHSGQGDIQNDLFYDYRTNVESYGKWQAWIREQQPRLLVIWGQYDLSFDLGEPERYRKDVPKAQVHVLNAGHFALDTAADEIACLVQNFVGSSHNDGA